jgi:6-phospho-beta-glucosidase
VTARAVVALLGGGSAFLPALAEELAAARDALPPLELRLWARDASRLAALARACNAVAARHGADQRWTDVAGVEPAVRGAAVVTWQARVGGLQARDRDERLARALDCPADETLGPAGVAAALRGAGPLIEAARCVARVAPSAWFVQLANPMGALLATLDEVPGLRALGLCELPEDTLRRALLRLPDRPAFGEVRVGWVGLNHRGAFTSVRVAGAERLDELLAAVTQPPRDSFFPWTADELRSLRALPVRHLRLALAPREVAAEERGRPRTRGAELQELSDRLHARWAASPNGELPAELRRRDMPWLRMTIVPALRALLGGEPARLWVSERNGSHVPWLPADAIVEKAVLLAASGAAAEPPGEASPPLRALLERCARAEAALAAAAVAPDADRVLAALLLDPAGPDEAAARHALPALLAEARAEAVVP